MRFTSHRASAQRAFTLIELLIFIAIRAILASILFPVFARARENACRASCQSNLKQIGLGLMQYTQDYDERLLGRYNGPADSDDTHLNMAGLPLTGMPRFPRSYMCNGNVSNIAGTPPMPQGNGQSLAALTDVARTVLIAESGNCDFSEVPTAAASGTEFAGYRFTGHLQTVNFAFAYSHVKAMKPMATATVNMWNIEETGDGDAKLVERIPVWQNNLT